MALGDVHFLFGSRARIDFGGLRRLRSLQKRRPPISEGNPVTNPVRPPSTQVDTRPAIVAFGDSLTAVFGAEPGNSYPDFLQKDVDGAGLRWRVINAGVSGDTTTDGVNRLGEVLAYKPRIVIVEFGGNDGLRGLPLETTRANLDQMIAALQNGGREGDTGGEDAAAHLWT